MRSLTLSLLLLTSVAFATQLGCKQKSKSDAKAPAPAKVELLPHESELGVITLTEEAEKRLGIQLVSVAFEKLQRRRTFGGEIMLPPGRVIQVTAPVGGRLVDSTDKSFLVAGSRVKTGAVLLTLSPLLSPERDVPTPAEQVQMAGAKATLVAAQVTARGDVERSTADLTAAKINVDRARKLFEDRAGSQRAVDDANAMYSVAEANLTAAKNRLEELTKLIGSLGTPAGDSQQATVIEIKSPLDGIIRNVNVSPHQPVVGGATMFEVIDTSRLWIRVPVFVDLLSELKTNCDVSVVQLDGSAPGAGKGSSVQAKPAIAPPSADPAASSADLYYELSDPDSTFRPGQRVGLSIPTSAEIEATVLPAATVLYDYHGGTWVYIQAGDRKFRRHRVQVLWFDGDRVILESRLPADTKCVTEGAAELFGTEFGPGK
ncbi:MAG: efflux RND transporter periplasmic adaptor subunit [Pirellulales bacterium]